MLRELGLRGAALTIYAIIYSFSGGGKGTFYGSHEMLEEFGGVSATTVKRVLKELLNNELILKTDGKKEGKKELIVNMEKIKNCQPHLSDAGSKSDCKPVQIGPQKSPKRTATESKMAPNNKHNNKQYIKPIINVYNGAEAPEREKEIFKEDLLGDKSTAQFPDGADTKVTAEGNPIYIKERSSPSENAKAHNGKGTDTEISKALPSQPKSSYLRSGHRKNFRRGEQLPYPSAFPTSKHMSFDPEEAFRLALERTEEWMAEIEERNKKEALLL